MHFAHFWRENSNFLSTITTFSNQSKSIIIAIIHLQRKIDFRIFLSVFCPFLARIFKLFKQYHSFFKSVKKCCLHYCNNLSSKKNRFSNFQNAFCPFLAQKFKLFKQYHNVFKSVQKSLLLHCYNSSSKRNK